MTATNLLADEQVRQSSVSRHPLGRLGQPDDVAYGALLLGSDQSPFITDCALAAALIAITIKD